MLQGFHVSSCSRETYRTVLEALGRYSCQLLEWLLTSWIVHWAFAVPAFHSRMLRVGSGQNFIAEDLQQPQIVLGPT